MANPEAPTILDAVGYQHLNSPGNYVAYGSNRGNWYIRQDVYFQNVQMINNMFSGIFRGIFRTIMFITGGFLNLAGSAAEGFLNLTLGNVIRFGDYVHDRGVVGLAESAAEGLLDLTLGNVIRFGDFIWSLFN